MCIRDRTYTLKVLAYQNTFLFFVDGEKVGSFKDLEHQAGRIGLRSYNREVTADNVTVRPLTDEEILLAQAPSEDPYQIKSTMQIEMCIRDRFRIGWSDRLN